MMRMLAEGRVRIDWKKRIDAALRLIEKRVLRMKAVWSERGNAGRNTGSRIKAAAKARRGYGSRRAVNLRHRARRSKPKQCQNQRETSNRGRLQATHGRMILQLGRHSTPALLHKLLSIRTSKTGVGCETPADLYVTMRRLSVST